MHLQPRYREALTNHLRNLQQLPGMSHLEFGEQRVLLCMRAQTAQLTQLAEEQKFAALC